VIPARGLATTWLVATLRSSEAFEREGYALGDAIAPEKAGWPKGQPGVQPETFQAYGVVKGLQAAPQRNPQAISDANASSWTFPYQLTGWGALREQADRVCDVMNEVLDGIDVRALRGDDSPVPGWDVQQLVITPLGTTDRTDQVSPPMWSRTDVCTIWLARANMRRRG
jgi:hypothetical protein